MGISVSSNIPEERESNINNNYLYMHLPVRSYGCVKLCLTTSKPVVHSFRPKTEGIDSSEKKIPSERASQGEWNDANVSSVAPSSEKLWVRKDIDQNA